MHGNDLESLRKAAHLSQAPLAQALAITPRTLGVWESQDTPIARPYVLAARVVFEDRLLVPAVVAAVQQAFEAIPSESVYLWLVRDYQAILLRNTSRYQCLREPAERADCPWNRPHACEGAKTHCLRNDFVARPLGESSLTTTPLRTGVLLNLAGADIEHHPAKLYRSRANAHLADGLAESLLKVPYFRATDRGPLPVAALGFENKLRRDGSAWKVIRASSPKSKRDAAKGSPEATTPKIYAAEDEKRALALIAKVVGDIEKHLMALDYFGGD